MTVEELEKKITEKIEDANTSITELLELPARIKLEDFEEYESWMQVFISVNRDIEKLKITIKHEELQLQRQYEEKGVKAIKTREQLARDDFTDVKLLLEDYKKIRDELYLQTEIQRYVMGI